MLSTNFCQMPFFGDLDHSGRSRTCFDILARYKLPVVRGAVVVEQEQYLIDEVKQTTGTQADRADVDRETRVGRVADHPATL